MIVPTVGRVVWFTPSVSSPSVRFSQTQPLAAIVAYVWHDRLINIAFFDQNGSAYNATSVPLLQDDDRKPEGGYFTSWMPYQKGQAAKAEAAEAAAK